MKKKNKILESGFSRVRGMMMGMVPSVNSIGIMTAENPDAMATPAKRNKQLNKDLMKTLRQMNYGPIPIGGSFGQKENSFLIPNISRQELGKLGVEFGQEAVIWAEKQTGSDGPYMRWEYMEGMNTVQTREVSLGGTDVQAKKDYYSEKDGRKFVIPFFDDEYEGAKTSQGGRSIDKKVPPMQEEVDKLENENATKLHEMIKKRAQYLTESTRSAKSKWHHRGLMELELRQLKKEYFKE
tara:strand:- start:6442 stop:7158 length:717 start_codon:yes stop_codon:yes gene_type:complete